MPTLSVDMETGWSSIEVRNPNTPVTRVWRTRNGEELRICDMEDTHLLNATRLVRRWVQMGARERAQDSLWPDRVDPNIQDRPMLADLIAEVERRKLRQ